MAVNAIGQCAPCCKQLSDCDTCARCYPKYLCVTATITADYGDSSCHCDMITGRLFSSSAFCGWSGSISCANDSLSFNVYIEKEGDDCSTVVEAIELGVTHTFPGVLRDIAFSGSYDGLLFEVTISAATMFVNPLAFGPCPICVCATCLPAAFCVIYQNYAEGTVLTGIMPWLCESQQYNGITLDDQTINLTLSTTSCELFATASAGSTVISLESNHTDDPDAKGIVCLESSGELTKGQAPFTSVAQPGFLTGSIIVSTGDTVTGLITIQELPCEGGCDACPDKPNHGLCCDYLPDSLTMQVRCTTDEDYGCDETQTQTVPWAAGYTGTFRFCDINEDIVIVADCDDDLVSQSEWSLSLTIPSLGGSGRRLANVVPCPGILLVAVFTKAKDYGAPRGVVTYTFEITVTL